MAYVIFKKDYDGSLFIHMKKYVERIEKGMHSHEFLEIEYVLSGEGRHMVGQNEIRVKPGDVFFTNYGTEHCFVSDNEENRLVVINCIFSPGFFDSNNLDIKKFSGTVCDLLYNFVFTEDIKKGPFLWAFDTDRSIRYLMEQMLVEYTNKPDGYEDYLAAALTMVFIHIMRAYKAQSSDKSKKAIKRHSIQDVLEHIQAHSKEPISLEELSYIALVSPTHLCAIFKETMGITISEYIQEEKVKLACKMLTETDKTFSEIAYEIGYKSDKFLRKLFIRKTGMNPSEYRRKNK